MPSRPRLPSNSQPPACCWPCPPWARAQLASPLLPTAGAGACSRAVTLPDSLAPPLRRRRSGCPPCGATWRRAASSETRGTTSRPLKDRSASAPVGVTRASAVACAVGAIRQGASLECFLRRSVRVAATEARAGRRAALVAAACLRLRDGRLDCLQRRGLQVQDARGIGPG